MKHIEVNSSHAGPHMIAYSDYGTGDPVVLIHGWPMTQDMWEYQIEPLVNAGNRVILYDRRGFGNSSRPWTGYDYDTLAADLKALLDKLDLTNVTLVGFSMGGGEVARYLGKYGSERISKAVLVSSVVPYLSKDTNNEDGVPKEVFTEMLDHLSNDRIGFLEGFGKHFFGVDMLHHPMSSALMTYYLNLSSTAFAQATKECVKSFAFTDFRKDLPAINVPTLIIHGNADKIVPIEVSSDKASKQIANNQYIVYEGAPHGLFYTHKEKLNTHLISFIATGKATVEEIPLLSASEVGTIPMM